MVRRPKLGPMRCSGAQPGASSGKGFWGVPTSPEEEERSCRCPWKGGSFLGPFAYGP